MSVAPLNSVPIAPGPTRGRSWLLLGLALAAFVAVRLPLMYRQPGGQDEDWFAVPGWTVATEGVPRVPYAPERHRESVFYKADQALFALPPAGFYWQAIFFLWLPAGYGTARVASAVAGLIAVWLVYELGRRIFQNESAGLWAAGLYSLSRVFLFPATMARPDMLCGTLGLAAVLAVWHWQGTGSLRVLAGAGVLLGLGLLSHPFAIVYCLQAGVWVLWHSPSWKRALRDASLLTGVTLLVFATWLPLILAWRDAFQEQFFGNVLDRSGPGLAARLLWPWPLVPHHAERLFERAGLWQTTLMAAGVAYAAVQALRGRVRGARLAAILAAGAVYLHVACQGGHPTQGYWCYTGGLMFLCVGKLAADLVQRLRFRSRRLATAAAALTLASMLPGAGLRTWTAHLQHWNDVNYDAPVFARSLLADLPKDAPLLVDPGYVFDAELAGYDTTLAVAHPFYFHGDEFEFEYLIVGRYGLENSLHQRLGGRLVATRGDRQDQFACYVEIYGPPENQRRE